MADDLIEGLSQLDNKLDISSIDDPQDELYELSDVGQKEKEAAEAVLSFYFYTDISSEAMNRDKAREALEDINKFKEEGIIKQETEFLHDENYVKEIERKLEDRNMNKTIAEFQEDVVPEERGDFVKIEKELIGYLLGRKYGENSSESGTRF